ncbi:MAG: hypothetical protein ACI4ME_11410 [Aristaeellaceae bacterium]
MYELSVAELKRMLQNGRRAEQYAWEHYEELASIQHVHTLYGPYVPGLGASIPCNTVTPKSARRLLTQTRRKDYIIYHLDDHYQLLRTIQVQDYTKITRVYHHFELDGIVYAYPFRGYEKKHAESKVHFFRYLDGKPVCYGVAYSNFVFCQFYEYVDENRMLVTTYRYFPTAKYTVHGYPVSEDAPIGALNSSVQRTFYEEIPESTDFSRWFK